MYKLTTTDGDTWNFDTLDEARRNKYIFEGEIKEILNEGDDKNSTDTI